MKVTIKIFGLLFFIMTGQIVLGQTNKEKALEKGNQAVKLEDEGKYEDAIRLFEEAQKLDPEKIDYPYEIAFCHIQLKEYKKAIDIAEKLTEHKNVEDVVYQLLGNTYDNMKKEKKAIETYETGLKKFPNSGRLYLEMGIMQMGKKDFNKALSYYEKGIEVAPKFPSNYYWAAKIYCSSTEEVWGMIYGELFMNLERNSKRTAEISKLLYDTYKSEIKFTSDSSVSVSFSQQMIINIDNDTSNIRLPFSMIYEPTLLMAVPMEKSIDINSLNRIRKGFVETYFQKGFNKTHPNILFDYQNELLESSNLEAYNYWILMKGDEDGFNKWQTENKEKLEVFVKWFNENKIPIDNSHKFYSGQY